MINFFYHTFKAKDKTIESILNVLKLNKEERQEFLKRYEMSEDQKIKNLSDIGKIIYKKGYINIDKFAKSIGTTQNYLNDVSSGRAKFSRVKFDRIVNSLKLSEREKEDFALKYLGRYESGRVLNSKIGSVSIGKILKQYKTNDLGKFILSKGKKVSDIGKELGFRIYGDMSEARIKKVIDFLNLTAEEEKEFREIYKRLYK